MFKIKDAWQIVENTHGVQIYTDTRDGQQYRYKQFGSQIWMIDNWNYGGLPGTYTTDWNSIQYQGKAFRYQKVDDYQNWQSEYGLNRGAIYCYDPGNGTGTILTNGMLPSGWHIATESEWTTLINWAISEYPGIGIQALMAKTTFWCPTNPSSSVIFNNYDKSGFGMVPAGYASRTSSSFGYSEKDSNCKAYFIITDNRIVTFEQAENVAPSYSFSGNYLNRSWASIRLVKDGGLPPAQPIITDIVTSLDSTGSDNKLATEKATRSAITSAVSSKMSNPMTTAGDLIVGGASGTPDRLGIGSNGYVLTVSSGSPSWASIPTQTGDHMVLSNASDGTAGYLYNKIRVGTGGLSKTTYTSGSSTAVELGIDVSGSTSGQVLTSTGTGVSWSAIPTQTGDHKVIVSSSDSTPDYIGNKLVNGSGITLTTSSNQLTIALDTTGASSGQLLSYDGSNVAWTNQVQIPKRIDWTVETAFINDTFNQALDRTFYVEMFPECEFSSIDAFVAILENSDPGDEWRVAVFDNKRNMTYYGTSTGTSQNFRKFTSLTKLADHTFDANNIYYLAISQHIIGSANSKLKSAGVSSPTYCWYEDVELTSGRAMPAVSSLTASTSKVPAIGLRGR